MVYGPLLITVGVLLIFKRKKQCMIAGFLYLIGGLILWMGKLIYSVIMMIERSSGDTSFEESYGNIIMVPFMLNILVVFFRLGCTYFIKIMYKPVCSLEEYIHEKEHAEFIQSLAQKNNKDEKLIEDEEITEDQLFNKNNNPFITGREKKEDNEDEEINFETNL